MKSPKCQGDFRLRTLLLPAENGVPRKPSDGNSGAPGPQNNLHTNILYSPFNFFAAPTLQGRSPARHISAFEREKPQKSV